MRVLDTRTRTIVEELIVHGNVPQRLLFWGNTCICNEADDLSRVAPFMIDAGALNQKTVAWIGGGFCAGPRAYMVSDCTQTVYEIEPALKEFCPRGITFIAGDWLKTLIGTYDIIVYDLGGPVPYESLSKYLNPKGKILPPN